MGDSSAFFANKSCRYYPCHEGTDHINCLFCFCPMYFLDACPGSPTYINKEGRIIKNCTGCTYPHQPENYETVMKVISRKIAEGRTSGIPDSEKKR